MILGDISAVCMQMFTLNEWKTEIEAEYKTEMYDGTDKLAFTPNKAMGIGMIIIGILVFKFK
ncbi:hypothetical protein MUN88_04370 [Gracilibacillus caseinilyticus]|uniref:Uncharacterized protein n=1 Tax=Gracilibacillus caseinilyticus TaxID=2932256 RepID=A0ABY4EY68_9BACI|nr:hypothetical protein [Gracilibacillus caseinilyticus]UOQ49360.1 hypothetical protein MUN88_04370 [Gracilibacillus caseinilyticus]